MRSNNNDVRSLFNSAATFPEPGQEFRGVVASITNQQTTCVFNDMPPGTYAVTLKGEAKMRAGFFGQPEEGHGFSRNAKGSMGPPAFNAAAYSYAGGNTSRPVTITYP